MKDKNLTDVTETDNEVIKALECCQDEMGCGRCPLFNEEKGTCKGAKGRIEKDTLDLINRLKSELFEKTEQLETAKAENESLESLSKHHRILINELNNGIAEARAEAYKEFAEKLKQDIKNHRLEMNMNGLKGTHRTDDMTYETIIEYIDNLLKELVGEK